MNAHTMKERYELYTKKDEDIKEEDDDQKSPRVRRERSRSFSNSLNIPSGNVDQDVKKFDKPFGSNPQLTSGRIDNENGEEQKKEKSDVMLDEDPNNVHKEDELEQEPINLKNSRGESKKDSKKNKNKKEDGKLMTEFKKSKENRRYSLNTSKSSSKDEIKGNKDRDNSKTKKRERKKNEEENIDFKKSKENRNGSVSSSRTRKRSKKGSTENEDNIKKENEKEIKDGEKKKHKNKNKSSSNKDESGDLIDYKKSNRDHSKTKKGEFGKSRESNLKDKIDENGEKPEIKK